MRIVVKTDCYNPRRDGRPWICRVTSWPIGAPKPEIVWGSWVGARPGSEGQLVIEAQEGDLIRWGQNDMRSHNHTYRTYAIVGPDGALTEIDATRACEYAQTQLVGHGNAQ